MNPARQAARYVVGIDLGTTNTVIAYADTHAAPEQPLPTPHAQPTGEDDHPAPRPRIDVLHLPQLVAPGEVESHPLLPSFRYHPSESEFTPADLSLAFPDPLPELARGFAGVFAQALGARVPGRLVASAKSWLCHPSVDRHAAILPWGSPAEVAKISPVDASASYLAHLRACWDAAHPSHPLESQEVVLTVPASFDDTARALTLEAATRAGLARVRLLEEPQAAFYDWLDRHHHELDTRLRPLRLALVLDVGGGTTDLTLIHVELRESGPRLTRIAVGDHILLGGDNMDHALARQCEAALTKDQNDGRLPASRFAQLLQQCQKAKERLLAPEPPARLPVTLLGTGGKLVGGQTTTSLERTQVQELVVEGFFPRVAPDARPKARHTGLVEFGLPFAADPAITRHVAAFLSKHQTESAQALGLSPDLLASDPSAALPDAVLFNGGVFASAALQTRTQEVLREWRGSELTLLDNPTPELAVARGAVAYGLARRGLGLKIGGGSPRGYYLLLDSPEPALKGVCILPRGADEGEEFTLAERGFALRVGKPVRFRLLTSTREQRHRPGQLLPLDEEDYTPLPDLAAVLESKQDGEVHVLLTAQLTEVGTLELSLRAADNPQERYKLEFQLRATAAESSDAPLEPARVTRAHPRLAQATELLDAYYGKADKDLQGKKIKTLRTDLEKLLGERESWDTPLLRELFGKLLAGKKRRRRSADHERLWFHLCGYCLRPGAGYPVDPWRIEQLWPLYEEGVQFVPDPQVWSQFWILWRRVAGGLTDAQQARLADDLLPHLHPPDPRHKTRLKGPRAQGLEDMVRLASSLERLPCARKVELGDLLLARLAKAELSAPTVHWSLGRLGARAPWYGSAHTVVPPEDAARWLTPLLQLDLRKHEQAAFAIAQLACLTHDRARDLDAPLRERAAARLEAAGGNEPWVKRIREGGQLDASQVGRLLGDSLPAGLRLL